MEPVQRGTQNQDLGRSRGGFSTKIDVRTNGDGLPIGVVLTPGEAHDSTAYPDLMAPLSVWAQFFCGLAFLFGALTRWAGLICAFNFVVACVMVHWHQDFRGWWPAAVLVVIGLVMATHGAGRFSIDERVSPNDRT